MHTDIKQAWANGELVQYKLDTGYPWRDWSNNEGLDLTISQFWRVAPKTININGHSVPEPLRSLDGVGEHWIADLRGPHHTTTVVFPNALRLGLCHTTREAAQAHADALLSFTRSDV